MYQPIIIRKPRFQITRKNHRFVGFKIGDKVIYSRNRVPQIVTEIEDCFDWNKKAGRPRREYSRYIYLKPLSPKKVGRRASHSYKNVMHYNSKLWQSGYIGHSVDYDQIYHTLGEYYHDCMRR